MRGVAPVALLASFSAGALVDGWLRTHGPPRPAQGPADEVRLKPGTTGTRPALSAPPPEVRLKPDTTGTRPVAPSSVVSGFSRTAATSGELSHSRLRLPIDGETIDALKGGFAERRSGTRPHEAVDLLAPRRTPVHAVEDGTIAKLFTSKAGGLAVY